jgi:hypothetical protein
VGCSVGRSLVGLGECHEGDGCDVARVAVTPMGLTHAERAGMVSAKWTPEEWKMRRRLAAMAIGALLVLGGLPLTALPAVASTGSCYDAQEAWDSYHNYLRRKYAGRGEVTLTQGEQRIVEQLTINMELACS